MEIETRFSVARKDIFFSLFKEFPFKKKISRDEIKMTLPFQVNASVNYHALLECVSWPDLSVMHYIINYRIYYRGLYVSHVCNKFYNVSHLCNKVVPDLHYNFSCKFLAFFGNYLEINYNVGLALPYYRGNLHYRIYYRRDLHNRPL